MDLTARCIVWVPQCLNLLQGSDCEQTNGRVCNDCLLNLRFERTTENIHKANEKPRCEIHGNSHVSSPVQCHLQYPHLSILSSTLHSLNPHSPSPCQSRIGRMSSELASSQSATDPRFPPEMPNRNNVYFTLRQRTHPRASLQGWPPLSPRTSTPPLSASESWLNVSAHSLFLFLPIDGILQVAKRKTLFDDRPVEISVSKQVFRRRIVK